MNTIEETKATGHDDPNVCLEQPAPRAHKVKNTNILILAGLLGVLAVGLLLTAPEFGVASGVVGLVASIGSAGMTVLARK